MMKATLCGSWTASQGPDQAALCLRGCCYGIKHWFGLIFLQGLGTYFFETKNRQKTSLGFIKPC